MNIQRMDYLDQVDDLLSLIPDENLPLLVEAGLLLSELLPPWDDKATYIEPLEETLTRSSEIGRITEEYFYPVDQLLSLDAE